MKVLIISHNPITTYQNMGKTLMSLFSSFKREELCQLYIYPTLPDIEICNSYYRITDYDVLKSFFRFGKMNSKVILPETIDNRKHTLYESEEIENIYRKRKKNSFTLLCRDIMWALSGWYNKPLEEWLMKEKPSCIYLAPGESKFIYEIALKISKKLDIDLFTYICDDYYFGQAKNGLDYIQKHLLKRKMKKTFKKSKSIITICDELSHAYCEEFGIKTYTITTGSNFSILKKPQKREEIKGITYMGNLACNRHTSLVDIGNCLDELNNENGTNYRLFLYTPKINKDIQKEFSKIKSIQHMGYVTGKEFDLSLHNADVLLHVEGFDSKAIERVKFSVSTKIADSLGSGILFIAYGPEEVSSIKHLIRNECAIVITKKADLKQSISQILFALNHESVINKALVTANKYHNSENNSEKVYSILTNN